MDIMTGFNGGRRHPGRTLQAAGVCGLLLLLGCGGDSGPSYTRFPVKGMVTIDGEPIADGSIGFTPDPDAGVQGPAAFASITNGAFEIPQDRGVVAGQHVFEIEVYGPRPSDPEEEVPVIGSLTARTQIPDGGLTDFKFEGTKKELLASPQNE